MIPRTLAAAALILAATSVASANSITGDPSADGGWSLVGNSLAKGIYASGAEQDSVNVYTTAFTLDASSSLFGLPGPGASAWASGDTIVGVGGAVAATTAAAGGWANYLSPVHNPNDLISNGNQRIVVKYGSSTSTFTASTTAPQPGNGAVSLGGSNGGTRRRSHRHLPHPLLQQRPVRHPQRRLPGTRHHRHHRRLRRPRYGTLEQQYPRRLQLPRPLPPPDSTYPTHANVSLGNQFILDMQDGSGNFTNALGALPSAAATTSAAVAPLPTSLSLGLTALASIAALSILRQKKTA